jgi:hypothetical protein
MLGLAGSRRLPFLRRGENLADSGWITVVGVAAGGGPAGAVALFQTGLQRRSASEDREHRQITERRAALLEVYTRYQLAADRLENAIRDLAGARRLAKSERGMGARRNLQSGDSFLEAFEAAQREYDEVCEVLKLVAPSKTKDVALQQRRLFNGFAPQGLDGSYDHEASRGLIAEAAQPVLEAMRHDLEAPE